MTNTFRWGTKMTNETPELNEISEKRAVSHLGFRHSGFFRHLAFVICHFPLLLFTMSAFAQKQGNRPVTLDQREGERRARVLVAEMLSQRPDQNVTNTGVMTIRDGEGNRREVKVKFALRVEGNKVLSSYDAVGSDGGGT